MVVNDGLNRGMTRLALKTFDFFSFIKKQKCLDVSLICR